MKITTRLQLSAMMFLEFFIWGAWFVTLGTFLIENLNANGAQTGAVFSTQSWGAIIAPFIIGLIADRYINAEKILGVLHLIGAFFFVPGIQYRSSYERLSSCRFLLPVDLYDIVYAHAGFG